MIHVIIDGYNLIRQVPGLVRHERESLEVARQKLITQLSEYKKIKRHKVTVVFDGALNLSEFAAEFVEAGIHVSFSPLTRTADDIIKEMVEAEKTRALVVSSDRAVQRAAELNGATVIAAPEFYKRLQFAALVAGSGDEVSVKTKPAHKRWTTFKRGNPQKLKKRARKHQKRVERL